MPLFGKRKKSKQKQSPTQSGDRIDDAVLSSGPSYDRLQGPSRSDSDDSGSDDEEAFSLRRPGEATPLLGAADDGAPGMHDCGCVPVVPLVFGFDSVDAVVRPGATTALVYSLLYLLDEADVACTRAGRWMWLTLAICLSVFGLGAVWWNVDSTFPPTWYHVTRAQTRGYRPRILRELWTCVSICIFLVSLGSFVVVVYFLAVYFHASDSSQATKRLFDADC